MRLPAVQREQRRVQIRPAIAEDEPVVALLSERVEVERSGEHGVALLARFGDFGTSGIGDER